MTSVNDGNFDQEIVDDKLVVLDVFATWCQPCKSLAKILDKVEGLYYDKVKMIKMNYDENQKAKELNVTALPTLFFFKNGEMVDRHVGLISESGLKEKINTLCQ